MQEFGIGVTALTGDCDMAYRQASVEEDIAEILETKKDIMNQILDGKKDKVKTSSVFESVVRRIVDKNT